MSLFIRCWLKVIVVFFFIWFIFSLLWHEKQIAQQHVSSPKIMFVVRTSSSFYRQRLIHLVETWISLVKNDVFFVSDRSLINISQSHVILTKHLCGPDGHSLTTLCCKTVHDFILFHRHRTFYDWFCHFDDDQYVHIVNLRSFLSKFNSSQPYYIGRNSWKEPFKRATQLRPTTFWFATLGAGVCLSKSLIDLLRPYTMIVSQFIEGCLQENYHDDIYLGFLIAAYLNLSLTRELRFHSHLEADFYSDKTKFLNHFHDQITFGFRLPDRTPNFLPQLYSINDDPFSMRTLHCLLYPENSPCALLMHQYLLKRTI